ncbi:type IV toxin-antitoxin system AbiEi family antitoxin domain-containing protein [Arthrobacter woluwensis]|uniref:type IV toxin-antitoxin system AbiEi family antitoxin domain-containing protein n=1 Tax=Arthrobacter woluwensis TaxID=156980 RepID=UPI001AAFDAA2|nr:type IV toxin-antitoxin system AbiEi family antitoxin domain-containing protein [Arthrobacter woluwensis]QTF70735.1 type IV toxin-antitoxin system AbiEi family antitoxin domain-containing protein [Arthrobacter woluwensis]
MTRPSTLVIRAQDFTVHGLSTDELSRRCRAGALIRLRRGSYVSASAWEQLTSRSRQELMFQVAVEAYGMRFPLWGPSSALLHGLPTRHHTSARIEPTHLLGTTAPGGRSKRAVTMHRPDGRLRHTVDINGLPCSDVVNTAIDVAMDEEFDWSVAVMDRLLNPQKLPSAGPVSAWESVAPTGRQPSTTPGGPDRRSGSGPAPVSLDHHTGSVDTPPSAPDRELVASVIDQIPQASRRRRLRAILDFSDPGGFLPGESLSRVAMHRLGFPRPELQTRFADRVGLIGYTDFCWRSARVIGEFDGREKYVKPEYLRGPSTSDIVIAEKTREDRLRHLGFTVVRWVWADVQNPERLASLLRQAGLPQTVRPEWGLARS